MIAAARRGVHQQRAGRAARGVVLALRDGRGTRDHRLPLGGERGVEAELRVGDRAPGVRSERHQPPIPADLRGERRVAAGRRWRHRGRLGPVEPQFRVGGVHRVAAGRGGATGVVDDVERVRLRRVLVHERDVLAGVDRVVDYRRLVAPVEQQEGRTKRPLQVLAQPVADQLRTRCVAPARRNVSQRREAPQLAANPGDRAAR